MDSWLVILFAGSDKQVGTTPIIATSLYTNMTIIGNIDWLKELFRVVCIKCKIQDSKYSKHSLHKTQTQNTNTKYATESTQALSAGMD